MHDKGKLFNLMFDLQGGLKPNLHGKAWKPYMLP